MSLERANFKKASGSRWPNRLAWLTTCATFVLIWVGGLVTTYHAGMAVPDWPTTFDYWWYPIRDWLYWSDKLLEHGHRTLAQVTGLLGIALAASLWLSDRRRSMRWIGIGLVAAVIAQGVLGGFRVLADNIYLADLHGCIAPLFFALCAAMVPLNSRSWLESDAPEQHPAARRLCRLAAAITAALYGEIVLGAQMRHNAADASPTWFEFWVWLKVITGGLITVAVVCLLIDVLRKVHQRPMIIRRAVLVAVMFLVQLALAVAAWVTHYGWPAWFTNNFWAFNYVPVAHGWLQVNLTTAHVAVGSLTLIAALNLTLWLHRLSRGLPR
jgi:heme a synthase